MIGMKKTHSILKVYNRNLALLLKGPKTFEYLYEIIFDKVNNRNFYEMRIDGKLVTGTYQEVNADIRKKAAILSFLLNDSPKNSFVGLSIPNNHELFILFWAVLMAGYAPLLLNPYSSDSVNANLLHDAGALFVITDGRTLEGFLSIPMNFCKNNYNSNPDFKPVWGHDVAICSSGSEATPHICVYNEAVIYDQSVYESRELKETCPWIQRMYKKDYKILAALPIYHIFGLMGQFFFGAYLWFTYVYPSSLDGKTILETIREHGVTSVYSIPLFWDSISDEALRKAKEKGAKTLKTFEKTLSLSAKLQKSGSTFALTFARSILFRKINRELFGNSLMFAVSGGCPLKPSTLYTINALGYPLFNGYGSSEAGLISLQMSSKFDDRTNGTIGKPFKGITFGLSDSKEIIINCDRRAYKIIRNGKETIANGPYHSGDLGRIAENGHYYIDGRVDDLYISPNGENISPDALEREYNFKTVSQSSILSYQDRLILVLYFNQKIDAKIYEDVITNLRNAPLASRNISKIYVAESSLLEKGFVKINRRILRQRLESGLLKVTPLSDFELSENNQTMIVDQKLMKEVIAIFNKYYEGKIRPQHDFFFDLGQTSLQYYSLLLDFNDKYSLLFDKTKSRLSTPYDFYLFILEGGNK